MRKMLPTAAGTLLAATWNNGDSIVINQSWKIAANPAGVTLTPNPNELAIVAFVQDDATKAVQQAAYSRPLLHNDAGVTAVTGIPAVTCSGSINPSVTIHNYAFDNLLSATVTLQVDAGPVQNFPWSGNIANGGNAVFAVPTVTLTTGSHTLLFGTTAPNTNADDNTVNDKKSVNATIMGATIPSPVVQGFVSAVWPTAWAIENVQNDTYKWARAAAGQSAANGSAKMDFYDSPNTNTDNFYSPLINFTNAILGASLDFYVSYAQYSTENDRLKISVSTDCGATWDTPIYNLAGSALATHVATTSAYTPAVPADWRHEVLSLNAYAGQTDILIQFSAISNYGNNLYIDDININDGTTGINLLNNTIEGINIYPNPSRGEFNVNVNFNQPQHLTIVVSNNIGEVVKTVEMKNISSDIIPINMVGMSKGTYIVTIKTDSDVVTKRISVIE
jgi:hypothetical protein